MQNAKGQFIKGTHWRPRALHWEADWLRSEYVAKGHSTGDIAAECGTTDAAIIYWLKKHGIARRTVAEARAIKQWGVAGANNPMYGKTGEQNPRYVDGRSPERQRLYAQGEGRAFLRAILARDKYQCIRCGAPKNGRKSLHVHHKKAWAGNPELRFVESNAVTLCQPCHSWVHSKQNVRAEYLA